MINLGMYLLVVVVFLQYLWGIETDKAAEQDLEGLQFLQYLWGIETTNIFLPPFFIFSSFYSTYEELKPITCSDFYNVVISFYSTYEELKPLILINIKVERVKFLQYLWGIETCISCLSYYLFKMFLQYLWGIETIFAYSVPIVTVKFLQYLWGIETK